MIPMNDSERLLTPATLAFHRSDEGSGSCHELLSIQGGTEMGDSRMACCWEKSEQACSGTLHMMQDQILPLDGYS